MGRFRNTNTNVVVSVDDSKDERFVSGWEAESEPKSKSSAKQSSSSKSSSSK